MIIPQDILQKQLCSQCHRYLSVGPIKVYPNRQIKCGRCSEDDNLGVKSSLYHAIVKDMKFPCVNRYDGCDSVLPISKMKHHESDCVDGSYDCFLCSKFKGIAYNLNMHCQQQHQKYMLQNSEFLIDFNKSYSEIFFHVKGIHLFFICCDYDAHLQRLSLDIIFFGKYFKGNMSYYLRLYSIEKELLYKSNKPLLCSIMEMELAKGAVVNIKSIQFPRKLGICQFLFTHEEPEFTLMEHIPVIDSTTDTSILKCTFKKLHEQNLEESVFFPAVYYFQDIAWKVFIKRKLSLTDYKRKFGVFLQWNDPPNDKFDSCKVSATFSVLSSDFRRRLSKNFVKKEYTGNFASHGFMLADWNYIMEPASGFVDDNSINVEVKMRIHLEFKKDVKCVDCYQNCFYCN